MAAVTDDLEVLTDTGAVRGTRRHGTRRWRGIPYAEPPVGALRFRAPRPARAWEGVRDATTSGPVSPQRRGALLSGLPRRVAMSESSLTLDVTSPDPAGGPPRPVLVYLHGGSYETGAGSARLYDGASLAREAGLVHVAGNYRLGALGFLDLRRYAAPDRPIEADLGLRDQELVLDWVRRNIAAFGGDPDRVTIVGESAGGTSVLALMCAPSAAGLFAGAIAQSPAPTSPAGADRAAGWAERFVGLLGGDPGELFTADPDRLVAATTELIARVPADEPSRLPLAPVVDGDWLPDSIIGTFRAGAAHAVPLLIGSNRDEATLFQGRVDYIATDEHEIERMLGATDAEGASAIRRAYPGYPADRAVAARLGGDSVFWAPSVAVAAAHSRRAPVWMYRYDFAPPLMRAIGVGATHAAELPMLFGGAGSPLVRGATVAGGRGAAVDLSQRMRRAWAGFVASGTAPWPRYDEEHRRTLVFDTADRIVADPDAERRIAMHRLLEDWPL